MMMGPVAFPYYSIAHKDWAGALSSLPQCLSIHVPWSMHESERGILDLSRKPRLCLEKVFDLAHKQSKRICVTLGFPGPNSIPAWANNLGTTVLVPRKALKKESPAFCISRVPSIFDNVIEDNFRTFVNELVALCNLYRVPEGPIVRVEFDIGYYQYVLTVPDAETIQSFLDQHYGDPVRFNTIFGTSFRGLSAEQFLRALPLLAERRPWILCSNMRQAIALQYNAWRDRVVPAGVGEKAFSNPAVLVEDDTCLLIEGSLLPYSPNGELYPPIAASYERIGRQYHKLSVSKGITSSETVVVCDKYIRRQRLLELRRLIETPVKFWPSPPIYDEFMNLIDHARYRRRDGEPTSVEDCLVC